MAVRTQQAKKKKSEKEFVPNIIAFACNWCSYAGADTAGVNRVQYSPHFRVIRTMCSGRVTPGFVLKALKLGADGVLVSGCHFGDCHYIFGNYKAVEQFEKTKALVKILGLEEERVAGAFRQATGIRGGCPGPDPGLRQAGGIHSAASSRGGEVPAGSDVVGSLEPWNEKSGEDAPIRVRERDLVDGSEHRCHA